MGLLGVLALGVAGCGELDDAGPSNGAIVVEQPPGSPAPVTYEEMCRHYCGTLEETVIYSCLGSGSSTADCAARYPDTAARCEELRCAPRRVEHSLCLVQCDTLGTHYAGYCDQQIADADRCVDPAASKVETCRLGCGPRP
jgi:hypothetical protein